MTDASEMVLFQQLTQAGRLGTGECSAIAVAIHRGHILAIDDKRAKKHALAIHNSLQVIGTLELMVMIIKSGLIDIPAADAIKEEWNAKHRFTLTIASFAELIF